MRVASDSTDPARKVGGWLCVPPFVAIFCRTGMCVTQIILEDLSVKKIYPI